MKTTLRNVVVDTVGIFVLVSLVFAAFVCIGLGFGLPIIHLRWVFLILGNALLSFLLALIKAS